MDIEENIKILENLKKYLNLLIYEGTHKIIYNDLGWDEKTIDCINAIAHILAEREEDKKRIEELEKENKEILNSKIGIDLSYDDYIPKQKVKEVIKKIKEILDIAEEQIESKIIIAHNDSLNFGRKQAHEKDIELIEKLLEDK